MAHLHVLARLGGDPPDSKGRDAACFVDYAVALQAIDPAVVEAACQRALEQLNDPSVMTEPILQALTLYPSDNQQLIALYRKQPETGASLFTLWHRQREDLPNELINQAELQGQDEERQYRALAYAADNPAQGLERFRAYYTGLLHETPTGIPPERLLLPALWGGLQRGDPEVPPVLRRALPQVVDPDVRHQLLRLLALNGDRADLPVLHEYYRQSPARGLHLLALTGRVESVPTLIDSLGRPDLSEESARAWTWLTGINLPQRPHLMLVDDQGGSRAPTYQDEEALKRVPDRATAEAWWQSSAPAWGDERRIAGAPLDTGRLIQLARERVGGGLTDLLDLLALQLQRPLDINPWGWTALRRQRLQALETTDAAQKTAAGRA
jgi:hypothetical protein